MIDFVIKFGAQEVEAAVISEGSPLDINADVLDGLVRALPVLHAGRALHIAPVRARAHDNANLNMQTFLNDSNELYCITNGQSLLYKDTLESLY